MEISVLEGTSELKKLSFSVCVYVSLYRAVSVSSTEPVLTKFHTPMYLGFKMWALEIVLNNLKNQLWSKISQKLFLNPLQKVIFKVCMQRGRKILGSISTKFERNEERGGFFETSLLFANKKLQRIGFNGFAKQCSND